VESTFEILVILGLILLNGFFAGAEIAVLTARRNRLQQAANSGSKSATAALSLVDDTNQFLSTVQVGITGIGTFAAAYGGVSLVHQLSQWLAKTPFELIARYSSGVALMIVTGAIAFVSLVLGELVPKRLALKYAESVAQFVAIPMVLLRTIARPAVALLGMTTNAVLTLLRVTPTEESQVSLQDIEHLIDTGKAQGLLDETEHEVAMEALHLRNRRVRDVMRPRIDVDAVDVETPAQEVVGAVAMSGFSRLPVYEGDLDHVIGFVYNKDLFLQFYLGREIDLRKVLRQPLFIPDTLPLDRLLLLFQERRTQLAIVLDEFGGTRGMVTFEDILEELVGDIHDEHRREERQRIVERADGSLLVDGQTPLHDLTDYLPKSVRVPAEALAASTVGGVVMNSLKEMPQVGDVVHCGDLRIEVADMDGVRVDRLLVSIEPGMGE
jgi:putative hemolysin